MKKEILLTTIILSSFLSSCDSFSSDVPTFTGYVAQDVQIIENSHIKLSRKFNQNSSLEEMSEENNIDNNQINMTLFL